MALQFAGIQDHYAYLNRLCTSHRPNLGKLDHSNWPEAVVISCHICNVMYRIIVIFYVFVYIELLLFNCKVIKIKIAAGLQSL